MNQQARNRHIEEKMVNILGVCDSISSTNKEIKSPKNSRKVKNNNKKILLNLIENLEGRTDDLREFLKTSDGETNEQIDFTQPANSKLNNSSIGR
jgi:hypothetical protein